MQNKIHLGVHMSVGMRMLGNVVLASFIKMKNLNSEVHLSGVLNICISFLRCAKFLGIVAGVMLLSNTAQATNFVYDQTGRLIGLVDPSGNIAKYSYDMTGNITAVNVSSSQAISILNVTPQGGAVGSSVTLFGTGFLPVTTNNTVTLNGIPVTILAATATSLTFIVPAGATTGKVSITNANGTAVSTADFNVRNSLAPTISGFTPSAGTVGTVVTITGTNFQVDKASDLIMLNGVLAQTVSATTTNLVTTVPQVTSSGKFMVSTPYGKAISSDDFFVPPSGYGVQDIGFTGRILTNGATAAANIVTPGKIGILLFDGIMGQNLGLGISTVTFNPNGGSATVFVKTPAGTDLMPGQTIAQGASLDFPVLPSSGTYTMVIVPAANYGLNAGLTLSTDVTGILQYNTTPTLLNVNRPGLNGRYSFNALAGQNISVAISDSTFASTNVSVFGPAQSQLLNSSIINGASGVSSQVIAPGDGVYSIFVSPVGPDSGKLNVSMIAPDLVVSAPTIGAITANQNGTFSASITFTVTNIGNSIAKANWWDEVYLSSGTMLDASAFAIGYTQRTSDLAPGASYVTTLNVTSPTGFGSGQYNLFVKTDGNDTGGKYDFRHNLAEQNYTNNIASIPLVLPNGPDLSISAPVAGAVTVNQNGTYSMPVTFTVTNVGASTAKAWWWDEVYLSSGNLLDSTAYSMGYLQRTSDLAPGASYVVSLTAVSPLGFGPGTYNLFVKTDGNDTGGKYDTRHSLTEQNVDNNVQYVGVTLRNL